MNTAMSAPITVYSFPCKKEAPAAQAGLVDYDIITAVDGTEILDVYHLQEEIFNHNVGDTVTLTILRSGESQEVTVTLGELKEESQ